MRLQDLKVGLENVVANPTLGKDVVQVVEARLDSDNNQVLVAVRLTVLTCKYSRNAVKLPYNEANKALYEQLQDKLKKNDYATVILLNPKVIPYAMISNGSLISGISIKADSARIADDDESLDV